jgi:hypothetical protein
MNYQYQSVPQKHLNNRRMPYHRGRGLGGSSAINFCSWLLGHREDYNQWAELVGDDAWKWEGEGGVKQRFRKIENLHDKIEDKLEKYINRDALKEHSKQGRLDLSYDKYWSETDTLGLEAGIEFNVTCAVRKIIIKYTDTTYPGRNKRRPELWRSYRVRNGAVFVLQWPPIISCNSLSIFTSIESCDLDRQPCCEGDI